MSATAVNRHRQMGLTPLACGFFHGRSPRWFEGLLWFSDVQGQAVHTVDMLGRMTTLPVPGHAPYGIDFSPDGSLFIASADARQLLRYDGETVTSIAELSDTVTGSLGDMVVDGLGRVYVGCPARADGAIVRVDPDRTMTVVARDLNLPSGMVISADGLTFIVAESVGRRLTAFSIDSDGGLSDRRIFAEGLEGSPDGITLDAEGGIWVALALAHRFQRLLPGGVVAHDIDIGDRTAIACMLGGPGRRTLFTLTSSHEYSRLPAGSCRLDTISVDVPGAGWP
jgi:sugar lactone lactonase YvrE